MNNPIFTSFDTLPMTLRVEDLMPILNIGRNTAYELVRSGRIKSLRIGPQFRISKMGLLRFIEDDHDPNPYKY